MYLYGTFHCVDIYLSLRRWPSPDPEVAIILLSSSIRSRRDAFERCRMTSLSPQEPSAVEDTACYTTDDVRYLRLFWMGMNLFDPAPGTLCDRHAPRAFPRPHAFFLLAVSIPPLFRARGAREDARCGDGDDRGEESESEEGGDELALLGEAQGSVHRRVTKLMTADKHA